MADEWEGSRNGGVGREMRLSAVATGVEEIGMNALERKIEPIKKHRVRKQPVKSSRRILTFERFEAEGVL